MTFMDDEVEALNRRQAVHSHFGDVRQPAAINGLEEARANDLGHALVKLERLIERSATIFADLGNTHYRMFGEGVALGAGAGDNAMTPKPEGLLNEVHGEIDRLGSIIDQIGRVEEALRRV